MRFDLHCNLPYPFVIPNAALGYLKGFLSGDSGIVVRNIYWNLFPSDLFKHFCSLMEQSSHYQLEDHFLVHLARMLYKKNSVQQHNIVGEYLLKYPLLSIHEIDDFSSKLKKFIDKTIEDDELSNADAAGFTMKTDQWLFNYNVLRKLKQTNNSLKTIIGGLLSAQQGLEFMRVFKEADFAIWGEGEVSLLRLLQRIHHPEEYREIPNLIYRDNGKIFSTYEIGYEELPDIDTYPFADHTDFFKIQKKCNLDFSVQIPILSTRSCKWNKCKFCVYNEGLFYRERSPENVTAEIEYQSKKHNVDEFTFVDNDIGRKNWKSFDRFLNLLTLISDNKKSPYRIKGSAISPLRLNRTTFKNMKKISLLHITIGFEATSDSLLKKMLKPQSYAHNIQALKLAQEENFLLLGLNIIRGIPTETVDDVIESIENLKFLKFFLHNYKLEPINFVLIKGAPFYKDLEKREIDTCWNDEVLWPLIEDLDFMTSSDKREFFGFQKGLVHSNLWERFQVVLDQYMSDCFSYRWFGYSDGSSVVEEYGRDVVDVRCRYMLSPLETALLTFCDMVRLFSDVRRHFVDVDEVELKRVMGPLKEAGLLYFNDDFKHHIISIVSTVYKHEL